MPEIIANTTDGYQASGLTSGWDNTHDKTSGQTLNTKELVGLSAFGKDGLS